ncbi:hypothetical protein DPMN_090249 [Dreissena polymorpha]|uniref:Uncharacterized protein n=1 Tax=Dreissena polymorpha TaxID=45954 RepID=A0A9D4KY96_DREPO|nr:hypothetical protein DPMN_090249 [Dreissena polymorpha]
MPYQSTTPGPKIKLSPRTVLGPCLFLAYINDLPDSLKRANVYFLSRDGLHLTIDGTNTVASNIEPAVTSLTKPTRPTYPGPDSQSSRPAPTHQTPTYEYGPRRYSDVLSGQDVTSHKKAAGGGGGGRGGGGGGGRGGGGDGGRGGGGGSRGSGGRGGGGAGGGRGGGGRGGGGRGGGGRGGGGGGGGGGRGGGGRGGGGRVVGGGGETRHEHHASPYTHLELNEIVRWIEDATKVPHSRKRQSGGGGTAVVHSNQKEPLSAQSVEDIMGACEAGKMCK